MYIKNYDYLSPAFSTRFVSRKNAFTNSLRRKESKTCLFHQIYTCIDQQRSQCENLASLLVPPKRNHLISVFLSFNNASINFIFLNIIKLYRKLAEKKQKNLFIQNMRTYKDMRMRPLHSFCVQDVNIFGKTFKLQEIKDKNFKLNDIIEH